MRIGGDKKINQHFLLDKNSKIVETIK